MGVLLETPLLWLVVVERLTHGLKLGQALLEHLMVGLVSFDTCSPADLVPVLLAARSGDAAREVALAELHARKTREWYARITPEYRVLRIKFMVFMREWSPNHNGEVYSAELQSGLRSLCSRAALLAAAHSVVGTVECLQGRAPSQYVSLLAGSTVLVALVSLAQPALRIGRQLQNQLAVSFGVLAAVLAGSAYAVAHTGGGGAPSAAVPLRRGTGPLLELGAPLGAAGLGTGAAVALFVFLCTVLLFAPALHVAKFYAERVIAARAGPRPRLHRALLRLWWYAPLLAAALWARPLAGDTLLPHDAVACGADAVARDCRASLPGVAGGDSWLALLPLGALAAALPARWAPPPLPAGLWIGETALCRLRAAAVLLFAALHFGRLQATVQAVLDGYWRRAAVAVTRAAPKRDAPPPTPKELTALSKRVEAEHLKNFLAPMVTMQVAAPPLLFAGLAVLLVRLGGLGGVGLCSALHASTGGALAGLRGVGGGGSDLRQVAQAVAQRLLGPGEASQLNEQLAKVLGAVTYAETLMTSPALWRPVLSFTIFSLLIAYAVLLEIALLYWRSVGGPEEEGVDDGAEAAKGEQRAAEDEGDEEPSILVKQEGKKKQ